MWSLNAFSRDRRGGVAPLLALAIVPIVSMVGAAVDYSRASSAQTQLQAALDASLLAAAKQADAGWQATAAGAFHAMTAANGATVAEPVFGVDAHGHYTGRATAEVPTKIAGLFGKSTLDIEAASSVKPAGGEDNSCILTLDKGAARSHVSMLFGGAPNIVLAGCSTRSNTSMNCNGHNGGATVSIAGGTATGCSNPQSYARPLPDIYERLAQHITRLCGGLAGGATWTPSLQPPLKTVSKGSYTEYHVCGDLTLSDVGTLAGLSASSDNVIVVENGSVKLTPGASITLPRTTLVLTGSGNASSMIDFPKGQGQSASLHLSPSISSENPWQGISVYQDPALTGRVANNWGPGATFTADGVVYLPNSDVEMQGIATSGNYNCSKIVTKTFTTKGAVSLNFSQRSEGCLAINMKQWADIPVHMVR